MKTYIIMPNDDFMDLGMGKMDKVFPYCGNIGWYASLKSAKSVVRNVISQIKDYHKEMVGKHLDLYESVDGSWGKMVYLKTMEVR